MNRNRTTAIAMFMVLSGGLAAKGQSSSLYLDESSIPLNLHQNSGMIDRLSPHVAKVSIVAVRAPEPRLFAVHDLITVIVRESIKNESEGELETEKEVTLTGSIPAFPNLNLSDLANLQLEPSLYEKGVPRLDISLNKDFEGEGSYERKDTFTTRLTARIIDIKPNGTLVLEARKLIQSDEEILNIVLTGTCRKEDVTVDNTVLSTQIYDLKLIKEHEGEIRKATKKGLITKFFDVLFNF